MRNLIAAINMTLDGFCDHTAISPDDEIHDHYRELLNSADAILYGRTTFQLMEYWQSLVQNPSGDKSMDEFAQAMDKIPKIVFSHTIDHVEWESARIAKGDLEEVVLELKQDSGKDIFLGSPSLIVACTQMKLIDEYQICTHPLLVGKGMPLFKNISNKVNLNLINTKTFGSGAIILYYNPTYHRDNGSQNI